MKTYISFILVYILLFSFSCHEITEVIPDINTQYGETFKIKIFSNQADTDVKYIDVKSSDKYKEFRGKIGTIEIERIHYRIDKLNTPEDMYFSGDVICFNEENTESYKIGSIPMVNLLDIASDTSYSELVPSVEALQKISLWLETPGRFALQSQYSLFNSDGTAYHIDGNNAGSNFELRLVLFVKVKPLG